jgi:hypothetical protein
MPDSKDDKTKFNETLKRMLGTPPKPHVGKDGPKLKTKPAARPAQVSSKAKG